MNFLGGREFWDFEDLINTLCSVDNFLINNIMGMAFAEVADTLRQNY